MKRLGCRTIGRSGRELGRQPMTIHSVRLLGKCDSCWRTRAWRSPRSTRWRLRNQDGLRAVNARAEVPVLIDGAVTVVNSADRVAYLEPPLRHTAGLTSRPGRLASPHARGSGGSPMVCSMRSCTISRFGLADPSAATDPGRPFGGGGFRRHRCDPRPDGIGIARPGVSVRRAFHCRFRAVPARVVLQAAGDGARRQNTRRYPLGSSTSAGAGRRSAGSRARAAGGARKVRRWTVTYEGERIVWRGDRLSGLFHNGFADWWYAEYRAGRAAVPGSLNHAG